MVESLGIFFLKMEVFIWSITLPEYNSKKIDQLIFTGSNIIFISQVKHLSFPHSKKILFIPKVGPCLTSHDIFLNSTVLLQEWYTVFDRYRRTNCIVSDLIMGNEYFFRVFSENLCGLSETAATTKNPAHIQKTGNIFFKTKVTKATKYQK